jgi:hypothetical protein
VFGRSAASLVGERLRGYVASHFGSNAAAAADLNISRSRLSSYTRDKAFPKAYLIDRIWEKWKLDLLGGEVSAKSRRAPPQNQPSAFQQMNLFEDPITLKNDQVTVTIQRKGPSLEVRLEMSVRTRIT